ncbi:MAG: ABC transporter substrate-binding protein [Candidatus Thorarchaeota archaeon]
MGKATHTTALVIIFALVVVLFGGIPLVNSYSESDSLLTGPYVDEVIFRIMTSQDQRILALQAGEIEMCKSFFDPVYYNTLNADPDIEIYRAPRRGYGHLVINCRKYPLNISAFRRAFAFAFDKTRVTAEIFNGFSQEHDSLVPYPNGWCVEDEFTQHYYADQTALGAALLVEAGFTIDAGTGFLLAPNGDSFDISIEYTSSSPEIAGEVAQIGVDALHRLGVDAETRAADFNEYISRLDSHGDYDMVFYATNFYSNDVDWLAYSYWSENADVDHQNPTNFRNTTYDSYRDALLYGTTYEEVFEASAEMQKILHYQVPALVVYVNTYIQGYRNDVFTGHVEDLRNHISGPWTSRKIHKIDGTSGGSVPLSQSCEFASFNFFATQSSMSSSVYIIMNENLHSSLYKRGPDVNPLPDLATSMTTETHSDNQAVPDGHTRFSIDIIQNATWSDGTPLTADDVAFTYAYQYESAAYGNPAGTVLEELVASYAPTAYRVVLEFSTESYWHFSDFAFDYIIPQHIFNDVDGIGYDGWNTWDPVFNATHPHVTCGPFIFSDYNRGEFYRLERNPLFHYAASPSVLTNETTTTITTTNQTQPEMNWSEVFSISIGSVSGIVIVYCVVSIIQNRRNREVL